MDDYTNSRRPLARLALLIIVIALGVRFIQIGLGDTPAVEAAPGKAARELLRVEWPGACGRADGLGLYAATDPACRPQRVVTLAWLQSQLIGAGLLVAGEYLEAASQPCGAIVRAADGTPAGWLCADSSGLYRLSASQDPQDARWQLWSDGAWVRLR